MLTHGNLLAVVAGQLLGMDKLGDVIMQEGVPQRFTPNDVMISYLPLAHIFDRRALAWGVLGLASSACDFMSPFLPLAHNL